MVLTNLFFKMSIFGFFLIIFGVGSMLLPPIEFPEIDFNQQVSGDGVVVVEEVYVEQPEDVMESVYLNQPNPLFIVAIILILLGIWGYIND